MMSDVQSCLQDYSVIASTFQLEEIMVASGIPEAAKFHPNSISSFRQIVGNELPNHTLHGGLIHKVIFEQTSEFQAQEENNLFDSLKSCDKTVLLPGYMCRKYFTQLVTKEHKTNVFVGVESYSNVDWMFYLQGWIPSHLINRVKFIAESGMWQWWLKVLGRNIKTRQHTDSVVVSVANE